jgi:pSer/pThr/pTyr-binding forkhead associated (FHA) protein
MGSCPACGAQVELGRLTGILGIVCRGCDAYNEPGATSCIGCGKPLAGAEPPSAAPPAPKADPVPAAAAAAAGPPPGAPVVRSFQKPAGGAATRFVPSALRPSLGARPPKPESPALTPIPLVSACPRCGAETGSGRFCAQCGQALVARGTPTQVFGARAPARAKLVLEGGDALGKATFQLDGESVQAGRSKGAILFPDDPCLAPHHATFFYRGAALHVRDEGAPGGIYLRLRGLSVPLRAGDPFVVGERLLRYAGLLPAAPADPPDGTRRLGAPRPAPPAVVVEEWLEGGTAGRVFVRSGPSVTIGRTGCAVSLGDDPQLSPSHAEIVVDQDRAARVRDLGSSSGTYVKVPAHAERELRDGDLVRMGREILRVALAE